MLVMLEFFGLWMFYYVLLCSISHDTNGMPNCIVIEIGITL